MLCVPLKRNHRANQRGGGLLFTLKYIHPATILPPSLCKLMPKIFELASQLWQTPAGDGFLPIHPVISQRGEA